MNLVEKVLARASGRARVEPGDTVVANVDRLIMHDLSGYLTSGLFEERVGGPVRYPDRVAMVFDHHFSPPTEESARILHENRKWARAHGIQLFDCGSGNIHHTVVQRGLIEPGMVVVGSDSHTPVHGTLGAFAAALGNDSHAGTVIPFGKAWFIVPHTVRIELHGTPRPGTTPRDVALWLTGEIGEGALIYAAVEFTGPYTRGLPFWDRWLFPLICVDIGAKCAFVEPDGVTASFVETLPGDRSGLIEHSDGDDVSETLRFDVSDVVPQVACPPTVGNVRPVAEVAGTSVQWAELGGHAGGRLEDFRAAAGVLAGRRVHPDIRLNVVPSSREVFSAALAEGLVEKLHTAGATWFPPSTGANQAYNMGAMAPGEATISTHARNFPGRNGSPDADMYLASAASVAAAALTGTITDPLDAATT